MDSLDIIKSLDTRLTASGGTTAPTTAPGPTAPCHSGSGVCADAIRSLTVCSDQLEGATQQQQQQHGTLGGAAAAAALPGSSNLLPGVMLGHCGSSTELVQLGAQLQLPHQPAWQSSPHSQLDPLHTTRWGSSCSLAASALGSLSQPGSATAVGAAAAARLVGSGGSGCFAQSSSPRGKAAASGEEHVRGLMVRNSSSGVMLGGHAAEAEMRGLLDRAAGASGSSSFIACQHTGGVGADMQLLGAPVGVPCYAGAAAAGGSPGMLGEAVPDMHAHTWQPQDVVVVTSGPVPTEGQVLALLGAPLPAEFDPVTGTHLPRPSCTEVVLFKGMGPQALSRHMVAQQLQHWGLPSRLAAGSGHLGPGGSGLLSSSLQPDGSARQDCEAFLGHLIGTARRELAAAGLGRVVVVLRVDQEGSSLTTALSDVGLVVAVSAHTKAAAQDAVVWMADQIAAVVQQ